MKKALLAILATLLILGLQAADLVTRIQVVDLDGAANQEALEQLVYATIGTSVGEPLSTPQLSQDVAALLKLRGIDDAQVKVTDREDGTLQVTFLLSLRQRISRVLLEGNETIKTKSLMAHAQSKQGNLVDEVEQAADRKRILEKYEKAGRYGTQVSQRLENDPDRPGEVILTFVVVEAPRAKLKGTAFTGNTVVEDGELRGALMTKRPWWRYLFRMGNYYNPNFRNMDVERILSLYAERGYLDAQVTNVTEEYLDEERSWVRIVYHIQEGEPYLLGKRTFQGNRLFSQEQLLKETRLVPGEAYSSTTAAADLEAMKGLYEGLGYLDLRVLPVLKKAPETHTVDLTYHIQEGEASRIAEIGITGNTYTRDHVIRRELAIFEDDLADIRKIRQTKNRLENLGYFESVEVLAKPTENPARRNLSIEVKEKPTGTISVGAAFSSEDSVLGFLELSETNFSLSKLLKGEKPKGDGQRMRAYVALGSDTTNVSLSLTEPSLFDGPFDLTNEIFLNTRYEDEYDERHVGYAISLGWPVAFQLPLLPSHTEYWRMSAGIRLEHIRISNLDDEEKFDEDDGNYPDSVPFPKGMNYSMRRDEGGEFANRLVLSMVRDTRNHYVFPNRGSRVMLDAEYITRALGSYADYLKFHAGVESYHPVYQDIFLRLSADAHAAQHLSGDDIKIFDRYFAGGYGTIRGFKRHDVSPVNRNENSIGGQTMLVGTAELIKPVKNFMFLKLFCDAGNVWWDSFDADLGDLNASLGIGVQFRQIPIRLDYGFPILTQGEHLDGKSGRFHFSIDYSF